MNSPRVKILHVVESYGGGTQAALASYVKSTPHLEHHLLRGERAGEVIVSEEALPFSSVAVLRKGVRGVFDVNRALKRLRPDVMHLHSSYAGVVGRIVPRHRTRVAYTPHCFAFERLDLARPVRLAIRCVEAVLARRTDVFVACSRRELQLATELGGSARGVFVPNVAALPLPGGSGAAYSTDTTVVAVGRASKQKRPALFAEVASRTRERSNIAFTWIGDGPMRATLEAGDVDVTGWSSAESVSDLLAHAQILFHTGAWEGFPMAVLEAHQAGLAVVAAECPALSDAPAEWVVSSPQAAQEAIEGIVGDEEMRARNLMQWGDYLQVNTQQNQRDALMSAYAGPNEPAS